MPKMLRKCAKCGKYTLKRDVCPYCGGKLSMPYPPRFSPVDKYGEYRRKYKMEREAEARSQKQTVPSSKQK